MYTRYQTLKKSLFFFNPFGQKKSWLILETGSRREGQWTWNLNDWFDHLKSLNYATASVGLFPSQQVVRIQNLWRFYFFGFFNWTESEGNRHFCGYLTSWQVAGPAVVCDCQRHHLSVQHCGHVPWLLRTGQWPGEYPSYLLIFPIPAGFSLSL